MKAAERKSVEELAEQCLRQGLIDRYEIGQRVTLQISGDSVDLRPKQAMTVLSAILKELGEGIPNWIPLK